MKEGQGRGGVASSTSNASKKTWLEERQPIIKALAAFRGREPSNPHTEAIETLVSSERDCFRRDCFVPGHVTGSAILVSSDNKRVLMNHHALLDKWIGFGGHADGDADIEAVAMRELHEESGVDAALLLPGIFDLDIHMIPPNDRKAEPEHKHFDVRYLFQAKLDDRFRLTPESNELQWCSFDEAMALPTDESMRRLLAKWKNFSLQAT